jgi:ACS family glucarate transporter-like MFS transporter
LFAPLMGWIVHSWGWEHVFVVMGGLGILFSGVWLKYIHNPKEHPSISAEELQLIEQNGGLVDMDQAKGGKSGPKWGYIRQLLCTRMMLGVYLGQFCINGITYFFLTWFPVYLVQERGMTILKAGFIASLPAICGFIGGVLGGVISDGLLRRGHSLTFARKTPIVCGLMLSTTMVICNYVQAEWMVVAFMALAFFGKGVGALGWAVVSDTSPKQIAGISGGLFNMFGNVASITTPIVIGYIISATGSFKYALVYVGANALVAVFSYLVIVGPIKRVVLREENGDPIVDDAPQLSGARS